MGLLVLPIKLRDLLGHEFEFFGNIVKGSLLGQFDVFLEFLELLLDFCDKFGFMSGNFGDHGLAENTAVKSAVQLQFALVALSPLLNALLHEIGHLLYRPQLMLAVGAEKSAVRTYPEFVGEAHYLKLLFMQETPPKLLFGWLIAAEVLLRGRLGQENWSFVQFRFLIVSLKRLASWLRFVRIWRR